jgi:hypothetical protein
MSRSRGRSRRKLTVGALLAAAAAVGLARGARYLRGRGDGPAGAGSPAGPVEAVPGAPAPAEAAPEEAVPGTPPETAAAPEDTAPEQTAPEQSAAPGDGGAGEGGTGHRGPAGR